MRKSTAWLHELGFSWLFSVHRARYRASTGGTWIATAGALLPKPAGCSTSSSKKTAMTQPWSHESFPDVYFLWQLLIRNTYKIYPISTMYLRLEYVWMLNTSVCNLVLRLTTYKRSCEGALEHGCNQAACRTPHFVRKKMCSDQRGRLLKGSI